MSHKVYYYQSRRGGSLYHHGIKGQEWGVRRYQYEDGSLTPAGEKRYSTGPATFMPTSYPRAPGRVAAAGIKDAYRSASRAVESARYKYDSLSETNKKRVRNGAIVATAYGLDRTVGKAIRRKALKMAAKAALITGGVVAAKKLVKAHPEVIDRVKTAGKSSVTKAADYIRNQNVADRVSGFLKNNGIYKKMNSRVMMGHG